MTNKFANPVGFLQEFCQKYNAAKCPDYMELPSAGQDHCKEFYYKCLFDGFEVTGKGIQKKQAKSDSARMMISLLEENKYFDKFGINNGNSVPNQIQPVHSATLNLKNPISALQEHCQKHKMDMPLYFESSSMGSFICECSLNDLKSYGNGSNKKTAKTESAANMCTKLNVPFAGEKVVDEQEYHTEKNAISALQELCAQSKSLPDPVYENKPSFLNQFVVVCNVGSLSAEGKDSTKKGAKLLAANRVLSQLIQQGSLSRPTENGFHGCESKVKLEPTTTEPKQKPIHPIVNMDVLDEYNINSDEEDSEEKNKHGKEEVNDTDTGINKLESLTLDDSIVEVEPLTVSEQQNLEITTFKKEAVVSEGDSVGENTRDGRSSGSHYHDSSASLQLNKKEDVYLMNVSGKVMLRSPTSTSPTLDDLKDQKVTLTGVVKNKEGLKNSINIEILNVETKRPTKDGSTQKTPTSECLMKWTKKEPH